MAVRRSRAFSLVLASSLLAGLLSTVSVVSPTSAAAADDQTPLVPAQSVGTVLAQEVEPAGKPLPAPHWPAAAEATVDLSKSSPGEPGEVSPSASSSDASGDTGPIGDVVEVAPAPQDTPAEPSAQLRSSKVLADDVPSPAASDSAAPSLSDSATTAPSAQPSESASPDPSPSADTISPDQVDVQVLDREAVAPVGGVGLGLRVTRDDGVATAGEVQVAIDYSGFKYAYGGDFASRLRLVKLPECALTTPEAEGCGERADVEAENDVAAGTLTATVAADPAEDGTSTMSVEGSGSVYALASSSSSDKGDYRASTLSPSGSWDVSTGSGAFTYSVPIQVPSPPMGKAPSLAMTYNSQSVDGRTSASNNQASWVGMGWDLQVGYIERRYRNCAKDGLPTIGDMCWDSPNSAREPDGAVYVINLNGVTSQLIQDNNGTGSYHLQDDPGWRVQHLWGGHGADDEYWAISTQDGARYYFGWGRSERTGSATASVYTVPVVGNDPGEPCHGQFPEPCTQAWRWNLDRAVDANEVETMYFYDKEYNHYRSVANVDQARSYVSSGYVKEIQYGWSAQTANGQLPAKIELTHVNRCVERMSDNDPLRSEPAACPSITDEPGSYPDVPVDLMCNGESSDYYCAGKTYYPTFFSTDMLWDIKSYVRDNDGASWDLVMQYQLKHGLPNPDGTIGKTLWLDYIQRKTYGSGTDLVLPVINFNGTDLDNKVGSTELNFRRISEVHGDLGATTTVHYTLPNACTSDDLPAQSSNTRPCFWQKWTPEGETEARTGWFKKYVVDRVTVDPTVEADNDGAPVMTTDYAYEGGAGWRFTADPLTPDEDESWSEWRGYKEVTISTGTGGTASSRHYWLYRGLDGDRKSKTDPSDTKTETVIDGYGDAHTDHAWLAGKVLEDSRRDDTGDAHERVLHYYWDHNTAQYEGLPDARFVREKETSTRTRKSDGTWREHVVQNEYDDAESASTTFGLPVRLDDQGEAGVSDNSCTKYGRAYNTDPYEGSDVKRWTVLVDQTKHYRAGCSTLTSSNEDGYQDGYVSTLYDHATAVADNKPVDGNPTEIRTYTASGSSRTVTADYDDAGRTVWSKDGKGNKTTTAYSPNNSWPIDGVTVTTPDPDGSATAAGPLATTTWFSRFWGTPWKSVDANGNTTRIDVDAAGRTSKVWLPTEEGGYPDGSASMTFAYSIPKGTNGSGVPDSVNGSPKITSKVLQTGGRYLSSYSYSDGLGRARETQTELPDAPVWDGKDVLVPARQVAVTRYDSAGNVTGSSAVFRSLGTAGSGQINPLVQDLPSYTDLVIDWAGRTTESRILVNGVAQDQGRTVTSYHDDYATTTPPTGRATDTYVDVFGRTAKVVEHSGSALYETLYSYTRKGELASITDTRGNATTYGYDWAGQRTSTTDPDAGASSSTYDANGQPASTTDATNTTLTYAYDNLGRQISLRNGTGTLAVWQYDIASGGKGLLAKTTGYDTDGNAYTTAVPAYDARGRATGSTTTIPAAITGLAGSYTTGYHYDAADHVTVIDYPAAGGLPAETVTAAYDDYGRPSRLTSDLATYVDSTGYDGYGRLTDRRYGLASASPNAGRTYSYDDAHGTRQLTGISTTTTVSGTTSTVQNDTYARNNSGEITALTEQTTGQRQCFTYDSLHRLTSAWTTGSGTACSTTGTPNPDFTKGPDPYQTSYTHDRMGNLQSATDTDASGTAVTRDYIYPGYAADGVTYTPGAPRPHGVTKIAHKTAAGTTTSTDTFTYDPAGRMLHRDEPDTLTDFTWTKTGRLATAKVTRSTGTELTSYTYSADGALILRTSPSETVAYLDGQELRRTGSTTTATRYYTSGTSPVAMRTTGTGNGKVTWLMADQQASTQLAVDATTGTATRRRYTPFGDERSGSLPSGTDRGFLGKPEDTTTGLSLLGARAYDPHLGRFLTPDPLVTPFDPQNLSAYSYGRNNPVAFSDPTGLCIRESDTGPCLDTGGDYDTAAIHNATNTDSSGDFDTGPVTVPMGTSSVTADSTDSLNKAIAVLVRQQPRIFEAWDPDNACRTGIDEGCQKIPWDSAAESVVLKILCAQKGLRCHGRQNLAQQLTAAAFFALEMEGALERRYGKSLARGCSHSFLPGTDVLLADGSHKDIEDIRVGDKITATDPESGKTETRRVLATITTKDDKDFVDLTVATEAADASIIATTTHPFWVESEHQWVHAGDIEPGMTLLTDERTAVRVKGVRDFHRQQRTHDFTVDGIHTYYVLAGAAPVLVHNTGPGCGVTAETLDQAWSTWNTPANLEHVIDPAKHGFGDLVAKTGGREGALRSIMDSLHGATDLPAAGRYEVNREISGETVTIRGAVVNGVPRLGTAFIPGKFPG